MYKYMYMCIYMYKYLYIYLSICILIYCIYTSIYVYIYRGRLASRRWSLTLPPATCLPIHGHTQPAGAGVGGRQPPIASTSPPSLFITSPIAAPFPREPPPRSPPEPSTRPPPPEPIKSSLE